MSFEEFVYFWKTKEKKGFKQTEIRGLLFLPDRLVGPPCSTFPLLCFQTFSITLGGGKKTKSPKA